MHSETTIHSDIPRLVGTPDIRTMVGRRVQDATDRFQDLLLEIRRLRHRAAKSQQDREGLGRLRLILGLLTAYGPPEDRLLRYQLRELGDELRRVAEVCLAA